MTGLEQSSAIAAYQSQANGMRRSHDENGSVQISGGSIFIKKLIKNEDLLFYNGAVKNVICQYLQNTYCGVL